jgi:hypothetical protein
VPVVEPAPVVDSVSVAQPAPVAEPVDPDGVPAPRRARRRGRTTLIVATAAVLGLVAGTCAGYLVQADRDPTKLPSLSQSTVAQAKGEGPEPLSVAQDHRRKSDGDLRKLLLARPKGAKEGDWAGHDGWMDLAIYSDTYEKPARAFTALMTDQFRRAAATAWEQGSAYSVEIRLVQYRQEEDLNAAGAAGNGQFWAEKKGGNRSWSIPGTGDGLAYVFSRPETKPGYLPMYSARAHAWRGDIAMEIWITDTKPIPKEKIMDLATRQMGRL